MQRRERMDTFGAVVLIGFAFLFGANQVMIKVMNGGYQPVFAAGARSAIAALCILVWMWARGLSPRVGPGVLPVSLALGLLFAAEFLCLFIALDLTTVVRATVVFYSMPVWLALAAHVFLPGERITPRKGAGLGLAFAGMALALADRGEGTGASLTGDLLGLGAAMSWAALALLARKAGEQGVGPQVQLFWMVAISAPVLLLASPLFGPLLRDPEPVHHLMLGLQSIVVVAVGMLVWLAMLSIYPAAGVASFSFLSPLFGLGLGWAILGETVGPLLLIAGATVAAGILLINLPGRKARAAAG
ncbi:MAG: DMT family transporter [Gemmobacter sp.]